MYLVIAAGKVVGGYNKTSTPRAYMYMYIRKSVWYDVLHTCICFATLLREHTGYIVILIQYMYSCTCIASV